jgi:hypothetical protein
MRKLVISAAVATVGLFALAGCANDPHGVYMERQSHLTAEVDKHVFVEGIHNVLMDDRPTHLSPFINE